MEQRQPENQNPKLRSGNEVDDSYFISSGRRSMKVRLLTLALMLGLGCGAASAHGNKVHVRGTVERVGADSVQVKTQDGKTVEVKLVASTAYVLHVNDKMAGDTLYQPGKGGIRR